MTTIVVVTAGLSQPSSTRLLGEQLAAATGRSLRAAGCDVEIIHVELRDLAHDVVNNLLTGFPPPALATAVEQVTAADGLIVVTPIFSASYSGLFKSFFDVLDPEALTGKPVLIAATGGSQRHSLALEYAVRPLFSYLRADIVPTAVYAASADWGTASRTGTGTASLTGTGTGVGTGAGTGVGPGVGTGVGPGVGTGVGPGVGTGVGTGVGSALSERIDRAGSQLARQLEHSDAVVAADPFANPTPFLELLSRTTPIG